MSSMVVPVAHIPNSAAHICSLHNLAETCNSLARPYLQSIRACTSVCNWHQCIDLAELVVALFCIPNSSAHVCGFIYFTYMCSNQVQQYLQSIGACTSMHDQLILTLILVADPTGLKAAEFAEC
jgi:hypothetical protein